MNYSPAGMEVLMRTNQPIPPPREFSTGREFIDTYISPLENYLRKSGNCFFHYQSEVLSISRVGSSKGADMADKAMRGSLKFIMLISSTLSSSISEESYHYFDVILDSSGTYNTPNFAGPGGIPAIGELKLRREDKLSYYIADSDIVKTKTVTTGPVIAVIGAGTSAVTSIKRLMSVPCKLIWITRCRPGKLPFSSKPDDPWHELYTYGNSLIEAPPAADKFEYRCGVDISAFKESYGPDGTPGIQITVTKKKCDESDTFSDPQTEVFNVDKVYCNVGYRPDLSISSELHVHYCWATEGPMKFAASLLSTGGASGDCMAQVLPGPETNLNPEPNFFIIGMKAYGRGNAFLLKRGYEQVESIMTFL